MTDLSLILVDFHDVGPEFGPGFPRLEDEETMAVGGSVVGSPRLLERVGIVDLSLVQTESARVQPTRLAGGRE